MKTFTIILALFTLLGCTNSGPWADHPPSPEDVYRTQKKQSGSTDRSHPYDTTQPASSIDPFGMMHATFAGRPEIDALQPMVDSVLTWHHLDTTDGMRSHFAESLLYKRYNSIVGLTEMEMLTYMYNHFTTGISLIEHIDQTAKLLEQSR